MKLGLAVNDVHAEWPDYTTTRLAMAAASMGHEVFYIGASDFAVGSDDHTYADASAVRRHTYRSGAVLLRELQEPNAVKLRVCLDDFDALLLRNNPNDDTFRRPWARMAPIDFGLHAAKRGLLVLNDPATLARSLTKMYLHDFPAEVRPATLITRSRNEATAYIAELGGNAVLKPLFGYGGHNVFLVRPEDAPNVNQMFEAVANDGYVIVQEYLPEAAKGDTRIFLVDGEPLRVGQKIAAVRRTRQVAGGDMRSNLTAGASAERAQVTQQMLDVADRFKSKLIADGIFLAGLDVVGDLVMEVNIMTPGTLRHAERLEDAHFSHEVIEALERRVELHQRRSAPATPT